MPSRGEAGAWSEVAGVGLEEDGRGPTGNGAEADVGVHELPGDKVEAVDAGGTGLGDKADMGAVVGESRGQIKPPDTVPCP